MRISVIICTWNRAELLRQTLEGLTVLRVPDGVDWELIVVNNNCTDETDAVVAEFAGRLPLRYLHEPRPGKSNALNAALPRATGDYLLFTDDDVLVDQGWLAALVESARRYPEAAVFGGPIAPWFPVPPDPTLLEAFPKLREGFATLNHDQGEGPLRSAGVQVNGANMALKRSALHGFRFDAKLGPNQDACTVGEEVDLVRRLHREGETVIWSPRMQVRHYNDPSRMTLPYLLRYYEGYGRTLIRLKGVPAGWTVFGAPWSLWRQLIQASLCHQAARLFPGSRTAALLWLRRYRKALGSIRECRAIAKESGPRRPSLPGPIDI